MEKELAKISTVLAIAVDMQKKTIKWLIIALLLSCIATCITSACLIHVLVSTNTQANVRATSCLTTTVKYRISKSKTVRPISEEKVVVEG